VTNCSISRDGYNRNERSEWRTSEYVYFGIESELRLSLLDSMNQFLGDCVFKGGKKYKSCFQR